MPSLRLYRHACRMTAELRGIRTLYRGCAKGIHARAYNIIFNVHRRRTTGELVEEKFETRVVEREITSSAA